MIGQVITWPFLLPITITLIVLVLYVVVPQRILEIAGPLKKWPHLRSVIFPYI